jgi:hypothetical protein
MDETKIVVSDMQTVYSTLLMIIYNEKHEFNYLRENSGI